jgi:hypothetical protein
MESSTSGPYASSGSGDLPSESSTSDYGSSSSHTHYESSGSSESYESSGSASSESSLYSLSSCSSCWIEAVDVPALANYDHGTYYASLHVQTMCPPVGWVIVESTHGAAISSEGVVTFGSEGEWIAIKASVNPWVEFSLLALQAWIQYKDSEGDWSDITDTTVTIQVGEQVNLRTFVRPMSELVEESWEIEGDRVKNYITEAAEGKIEEVGDSLTFYWYKAGEYKVTYVLKINSFDGKVITKSATFKVKKPTVEITPVTDHMRFYLIPPAVLPIPTRALTFGRNDGTDASVEGILLTASPAGQYEGEFNWYNMIESSYSEIKIEGDAPDVKSHSDAYDGDSFPYAETIEGGLVFPDTPGVATPQNPIEYLKCNGNFTSYFIFRSSKPASIWVPLKRASWFYNGEGRKIGDSYQITLDDHSTDATVEIADEEELREWDHFVPRTR